MIRDGTVRIIPNDIPSIGNVTATSVTIRSIVTRIIRKNGGGDIDCTTGIINPAADAGV